MAVIWPSVLSKVRIQISTGRGIGRGLGVALCVDLFPGVAI